MKRNKFEDMSIDELWALHENLASTLAKKIEDEIVRLQGRLRALEDKPALRSSAEVPKRRRYPKVTPKFQNPERPSETWAGRGTQPRWMGELLQAGRSIDDLRIARTLETAS
jgi:DNA-binding protein H-NS